MSGGVAYADARTRTAETLTPYVENVIANFGYSAARLLRRAKDAVTL